MGLSTCGLLPSDVHTRHSHQPLPITFPQPETKEKHYTSTYKYSLFCINTTRNTSWWGMGVFESHLSGSHLAQTSVYRVPRSRFMFSVWFKDTLPQAKKFKVKFNFGSLALFWNEFTNRGEAIDSRGWAITTWTSHHWEWMFVSGDVFPLCGGGGQGKGYTSGLFRK